MCKPENISFDLNNLEEVSKESAKKLKQYGIDSMEDFKKKMETPRGIVDLLEVDGMTYAELKSIYNNRWGKLELDLDIPERDGYEG